MKLLFNICLFIGLSSSLLSFDVRVLLERYSVLDGKKQEFKVSCPHGLMVSGIENKISGALLIACTDKDILINDIPVTDEWIQISPALSVHHEKKIDQFVSQWLKNNQTACNEQMLGLSSFYKKFVLDHNFRDYAPLYDVMQACINDCIASFVESIEYPSVSYESLVESSKKQLKEQLKILLITAVAEKKVSKQLLKQLQISEKIRTDFFTKILDQILADFLKKYFLQLPHKIIYQAIKEDASCLSFNKNKYVGMFYLIRQGTDILLINSLDIDDYLLSVVFSEGWPGWPMEVNKALVVASRTYLVEKILQANKSKRPYHIVNSIKHQTYKGHHKFIKLKQAVDETRNIFIAYNGHPIVAMFDSCCGGVIPAKIEGLDCKKHPYLARTKPCTYCKKSWIYNWKKELSKLEITEVLRKDHPDLQEIKDIKVTERDPAGLVKQVFVIAPHKKLSISGKKMYSLFPSIKSFCYTIKKKGKGYIFQGKGYGHHMGLCQWGSLGMVEDGWNYKSILQFYYPETEFMQLSLSR
jgi:stage II sporulation protein D